MAVVRMLQLATCSLLSRIQTQWRPLNTLSHRRARSLNTYGGAEGAAAGAMLSHTDAHSVFYSLTHAFSLNTHTHTHTHTHTLNTAGSAEDSAAGAMQSRGAADGLQQIYSWPSGYKRNIRHRSTSRLEGRHPRHIHRRAQRQRQK